MARKLAALVGVSACVGSASAAGFPWPHHWPWHTTTTTTTTTTPQPSVDAFARGFADGLGLADASKCLSDSSVGVKDLETGVEEYLKNTWIDKGKAFVKIGEAVKEISLALSPCSQADGGAIKLKQLIGYLQDKRYYTMHNAAILALNTADDRKQLTAVSNAWKQGNYHEAGSDLGSVLVDVLGNPGLPDRNRTEALDFATGLAEGFSGAVDNHCFKHASIEIGAVAGGVSDLLSVIEIPQGLASIFQGIQGIVPLYKECMADKKEIMQLLHDMEDLKHPSELARTAAHNIQANGIDLSLKAAAGYLDFKDKSWKRFGEDVGAILSMIFSTPAPSSKIIV